MNQTQLSVLRLAIINLYFHHITIGFEDKYDERIVSRIIGNFEKELFIELFKPSFKD